MATQSSCDNKIQCPNCQWEHKPGVGPLHDGVYKGHCRHCGVLFTFRAKSSPVSKVSLNVNGKSYEVSGDAVTSALNEFLRTTAGLTATKYMCYEGGCGTCVVAASFYDERTKKQRTIAINSCLRPVYLCNGWSITTTEGIGSSRTKFHPIQERIADYNGSQCGYCTPGMVMSMYSLLKEKPDATSADVEDAFDGNICRCTGYRAILNAMHTFPKDKAPLCVDIEEMGNTKCRKSESGGSCAGSCRPLVGEPLYVMLTDSDIYSPTSLTELNTVLRQLADKKVRLTFGNTATGVYRDGGFDVYVDLKGVKELNQVTISESALSLGANCSLSDMAELLKQASVQPAYAYCKIIADHILKVANKPVRNAGCWAGNLMMRKQHPGFPSDVFLLLETVNAIITVGNPMTGSTSQMSPLQVVTDTSPVLKVIQSVTLPQMTAADHVMTYKVMARAQNAHAYVSAGFWVRLDQNGEVMGRPNPRIVYTGINNTFVHARKTEDFIIGKPLTNNQVFQDVLKVLEGEVVPNEDPVLASVTYRKNLALSLLYKYVLYVSEAHLPDRLKSGGYQLDRPISSGQQNYDTDHTKWPVTQPIPKFAAKLQASGEAQYIDSLPVLPGELFAQFVLSTEGNAKIDKIDPSQALMMPGVVAFLAASDIKGENNFSPVGLDAEEVFCSGQVLYAGQAIGIIIAESQGLAIGAASAVKVTYKDVQPPILTIADAIKAGHMQHDSKNDLITGDPDGAISSSAHVMSGTVDMETQYHFHMETQTAVCIPTEDGMEVNASTQWPDVTQQGVAKVLAINNSSVHVKVRRLGGAYGGKISRNGGVSAACAIAANHLNRPVRLALTFGANMKMIGKRFPYTAQYKVGVTEEGRLNGVEIIYTSDCGFSRNENTAPFLTTYLDNAYKCDNWKMVPQSVTTNTASNTYCRAPGSVPAVFMMETMMEHVAEVLNKDPLEVKQLNLYNKGDVTPYGMALPYCNIRDMVTQLQSQADILDRKQEVAAFNQANRWRKKGLSVVPMKYGVGWTGVPYSCVVAVYNGDGTVGIAHGGIEVGQGINTKAIQVCAYELGIPLDMIKVLPTETLANANSTATGSSTTSELCCMGVIECCKQIKARMASVRATMDDPTDWKKLVQECYAKEIDLSARYWVSPKSKEVFQYQSYGVTCAEVELDVLTGENQVNRVDILFDCGESINPEIDMGQIEGAFVMGMGYYLLEKIRYDPNTGENLSATTWEYKPPSSHDIPVDFRVTLLKNNPNPLGVLGSKACAEPPLTTTCSVLFALKHAIEAARQDIGKDSHFDLGPPATVEVAHTSCLPGITQYTLQ